MKKIISLLLAVIMILSLASCGTTADNVETIDFEKGVVDGSVYTSEIGGIRFTAPKGYEYFSDEMIAEVFGITTETLELGEVTSTVYDMYCYNEISRSSINVNFENLVMTHGADFTEEEYIEDCMTSYKITFNSFQDVILQSIEDSTVTIDGTEYACIDMVLDNDGEEFFETLIVKKVGNYMMSFTVAAYTQDEMDNIISCISEI